MSLLRGIKAMVHYSPEYGGYALRFIKDENGKQYTVNVPNIEWIETYQGNYLQPMVITEFTDGRAEGEKGNLYGENLALKSEIQFLREQIAKMLEKV